MYRESPARDVTGPGASCVVGIGAACVIGPSGCRPSWRGDYRKLANASANPANAPRHRETAQTTLLRTNSFQRQENDPHDTPWQSGHSLRSAQESRKTTDALKCANPRITFARPNPLTCRVICIRLIRVKIPQQGGLTKCFKDSLMRLFSTTGDRHGFPHRRHRAASGQHTLDRL